MFSSVGIVHCEERRASSDRHDESVAALDGFSANKSLMGMRLYAWCSFTLGNVESATGGASTLPGSSGFGTHDAT